MDYQEKITRNEAILQFMGYTHYPEGIDPTIPGVMGYNKPGWYRKSPNGTLLGFHDPEFHYNWNQLMPVVLKVLALPKYPVLIQDGDWILEHYQIMATSLFLKFSRIQGDNWSRSTHTFTSQIGDTDVKDTIDAYWRAITDFCLEWSKQKLSLPNSHE